ncbi:hypothetical protein [Roseomonas chloroacetimidivorans]|uniref:hypothetical protein n=1 Tax=Roseomonas chloroacetimidivorans TaxID=1766656 RepID=UPI003C77F760
MRRPDRPEQFIRVETLARQPSPLKSKKGKAVEPAWSIRDILGEVTRQPGHHPHVPNPMPPVLLHGHSPKQVVELAEGRAGEARDALGRHVRMDAPIAVSWVASYPLTWEKVRASPEATAVYEAWRDRSVEFFVQRTGGLIDSILLHEDEPYPHLHGLGAVPLVPGQTKAGEAIRRLEIGALDPARTARDQAKRAGKSGGEAASAAYRNLAFAYSVAVGLDSGLRMPGLEGCGRRRLPSSAFKERRAREGAAGPARTQGLPDLSADRMLVAQAALARLRVIPDLRAPVERFSPETGFVDLLPVGTVERGRVLAPLLRQREDDHADAAAQALLDAQARRQVEAEAAIRRAKEAEARLAVAEPRAARLDQLVEALGAIGSVPRRIADALEPLAPVAAGLVLRLERTLLGARNGQQAAEDATKRERERNARLAEEVAAAKKVRDEVEGRWRDLRSVDEAEDELGGRLGRMAAALPRTVDMIRQGLAAAGKVADGLRTIIADLREDLANERHLRTEAERQLSEARNDAESGTEAVQALKAIQTADTLGAGQGSPPVLVALARHAPNLVAGVRMLLRRPASADAGLAEGRRRLTEIEAGGTVLSLAPDGTLDQAGITAARQEHLVGHEAVLTLLVQKRRDEERLAAAQTRTAELETTQRQTAQEVEKIARAVPASISGATTLERIRNAIVARGEAQVGQRPPVGTSGSAKTATTTRPSLHQQIVDRAIDDARSGRQDMAGLPRSPETLKLYQDARRQIARRADSLEILKDPAERARFSRAVIGPAVFDRLAMLAAAPPERSQRTHGTPSAAARARNHNQSRSASPTINH